VGHSLCHGDLGNRELLLSAGETLDAPYWRSQTQRLSAIVLESIGRDGWLCGAPLGVESPGLMTGISGIGSTQASDRVWVVRTFTCGSDIAVNALCRNGVIINATVQKRFGRYSAST